MASAYYKIWRVKKQNFQEGDTEVNVYYDRTVLGNTSTYLAGTKTVRVRRNSCSNPEKYIYLKFLDTDGKYKFIQFERIYTSETEAEEIGRVSKLNSSFTSAQGNKYSLGYTAKKYINASVNLSNDEYNAAAGLFVSPRVYLQINETSDLNDEENNWLLVNVTNEGGAFMSKKNSQILSVRIELPDQHTIKM